MVVLHNMIVYTLFTRRTYQAYGPLYENQEDLSPPNRHKRAKSVEHEDLLRKVDLI